MPAPGSASTLMIQGRPTDTSRQVSDRLLHVVLSLVFVHLGNGLGLVPQCNCIHGQLSTLSPTRIPADSRRSNRYQLVTRSIGIAIIPETHLLAAPSYRSLYVLWASSLAACWASWSTRRSRAVRSWDSRLSACSAASSTVGGTAPGDIGRTGLPFEGLDAGGFGGADGDLLGTPRPVVVGFRRGVRAAIDSSSPSKALELVVAVLFFVAADVLGVLEVAYHRVIAVHLCAVVTGNDFDSIALDVASRYMIVEFMLYREAQAQRAVSCRNWVLEVVPSRVG